MGLLDDLTSPPKERKGVADDNVTKLFQPGALKYPLTDFLRGVARGLLTQAVEVEVADFLGKHGDLETGDGH